MSPAGWSNDEDDDVPGNCDVCILSPLPPIPPPPPAPPELALPGPCTLPPPPPGPPGAVATIPGDIPIGLCGVRRPPVPQTPPAAAAFWALPLTTARSSCRTSSDEFNPLTLGPPLLPPPPPPPPLAPPARREEGLTALLWKNNNNNKQTKWRTVGARMMGYLHSPSGGLKWGLFTHIQ